jgi:hypothetical protein
MSHLDPKRRTSTAELRKFGLLVGGVFVAAAALTWWRHRPQGLYLTFAVVGGLLVVVGAVAPGALRAVYAGWMKLAMVLNKVTTPIFMAVIYFVVLTPTGLIRRALGWKALGGDSNADTFWVTRPAGERASSLERQF